MIADGNPAVIRGINFVGLERHNVAHDVNRALKESYRILYRSDLNTKQAVAELDRTFPDIPEVRELVEFIETSERGIIR
jgi:UDP-N-acetylglucosamine acyltransferase